MEDFKVMEAKDGVAVFKVRTYRDHYVYEVVSYDPETFRYRTLMRRETLGGARVYAKRVRDGLV